MTFAAWPPSSDRSFGPRPKAAMRVRPLYGPSDMPAILWRERWLMLLVFLVVAAAGLILAFTLKTVYPAHSSILVRLGEEYVYQPQVGDAARGAVPENDQLIQSEVEILSSAQLKEEVIKQLGVGTIYPALGKAYEHANTPDDREKVISKAVGAMTKALKIETALGAPVVRLTFTNDNPRIAALTLNTLLDQYLVYRRSILLDQSQPLVDERNAFQNQLAQADTDYENFLGSNNIGDFEAEKASLAQLQAQLEQQKYAADSQLSERQGRLGALSAEAGQLPPEVSLYRDVDHQAQDELAKLKVQREGLLSRYRPDAAPVRDLDAQIATLQAGVSQGQLQTEGAKRVGINPVYQTVQTDKIQLTAEVAALKQSSEALAHQIAEVTDRQLRLARLEPQFQGLALHRDLLQSDVRDFTVKAQQTQTAAAIASQGSDNISIVERAVPPAQGKSLKTPVAILAILVALFTAACAGLGRAYLRPGLATASSAGRTLDLPVLATARMKD
jgi:uncharacterized protein involved in exopolysaccharide biosynthesis